MLNAFTVMKTVMSQERGDLMTDKEKRALKSVSSSFWGSHQRFFNSMCMSAKVCKEAS